MKQILSEIRAALFATLALATVCCGLYPLIVFGIGQLVFRNQANGSLIVDGQGIVRGSQLIGQAFTNATYFHSRPSAAGNGYDAASSGGSNLGPTSQKLRDTINDRAVLFRQENGMEETARVPADAVTSSGSGLDPQITPECARLQVARVAAARGLPPARVTALVNRLVEPPQFGLLGEARINVLRLNMALDNINRP